MYHCFLFLALVLVSSVNGAVVSNNDECKVTNRFGTQTDLSILTEASWIGSQGLGGSVAYKWVVSPCKKDTSFCPDGFQAYIAQKNNKTEAKCGKDAYFQTIVSKSGGAGDPIVINYLGNALANPPMQRKAILTIVCEPAVIKTALVGCHDKTTFGSAFVYHFTCSSGIACGSGPALPPAPTPPPPASTPVPPQCLVKNAKGNVTDIASIPPKALDGQGTEYWSLSVCQKDNSCVPASAGGGKQAYLIWGNKMKCNASTPIFDTLVSASGGAGDQIILKYSGTAGSNPVTATVSITCDPKVFGSVLHRCTDRVQGNQYKIMCYSWAACCQSAYGCPPPPPIPPTPAAAQFPKLQEAGCEVQSSKGTWTSLRALQPSRFTSGTGMKGSTRDFYRWDIELCHGVGDHFCAEGINAFIAQENLQTDSCLENAFFRKFLKGSGGDGEPINMQFLGDPTPGFAMPRIAELTIECDTSAPANQLTGCTQKTSRSKVNGTESWVYTINCKSQVACSHKQIPQRPCICKMREYKSKDCTGIPAITWKAFSHTCTPFGRGGATASETCKAVTVYSDSKCGVKTPSTAGGYCQAWTNSMGVSGSVSTECGHNSIGSAVRSAVLSVLLVVTAVLAW